MSKKSEHTQPVPVIGEGATLGVIGAGVMGQTLLRGLLSGKLVAHDRVWAGDKNPGTCEAASEALALNRTTRRWRWPRCATRGCGARRC